MLDLPTKFIEYYKKMDKTTRLEFLDFLNRKREGILDEKDSEN